MTLAQSLENCLLNGEMVWHWLRDNPEWGEYTLLFVSLQLDDDGAVVAGLWEVWDQGTGAEDPVMFKPADPERVPGEPTQWLRFSTVTEALDDLSVHSVSVAGFGSRDDLVTAYGVSVRARPAPPKHRRRMPFAAIEVPGQDAEN